VGLVAIGLWLLAKLIQAVALVLRNIYESFVRIVRYAIAEIESPSHILYISLFAIGAIGSAWQVIHHFSVLAKTDLGFLLFWSLWAFFTTNVLQQYLIYRTCIDAELPSSPIAIFYGTWWVGTTLEKLIRVAVVALLLCVAGEVYHFEKDKLTSVMEIARFNVALFSTFALWSLFALSKWNPPSTLTLAEKSIRRKEVSNGIWLDLFATGLWIFVWLSSASTVENTTALSLIILTAGLYAFLVAAIHVRKKPWNRSVFLSLVGLVLLSYMTNAYYPSVISGLRARVSLLAPKPIVELVESADSTHGEGSK
jgi:hypothetical protein